ncbi:MAG: type II toxin-antitoxin system RelE/ParE family toxin [Chthoniobacteraceae bacterium]
MRVRFLSVARRELTQATDYYHAISAELAEGFLDEIELTLQRIVKHPQAWAPLSKRSRRCRTNRFPYGIVYQVRTDEVLIVAVMHLARHPDRWRGNPGDPESE